MSNVEIDIENCGEDVYILRARGHHDLHEFMRKVREDYNWPLGMPQHLYQRTVPAPKNSTYNCLYAFAEKGQRGAYPVTYVTEAYNDETYEAIMAAKEPT